jgi:AcrR family transcriptional regulator
MFGKSAAGGATARRERARREMRAAIIEAARQIIVDQGVDALTVRSVATRLGYSAGALYEYFASKEAILVALYFESEDGMDRAIAGATDELPAGTSPVEALIAIGHAYRRHALDHAELYRMAFETFKTPPAPGAGEPDHTESGAFGILLRTTERGVREGVFIDTEPIAIAFSAWAGVHGFVSLEVTGRLAGGDGPGRPAATPAAGRERRDQLFDLHARAIAQGFTRKES